MKILLKKDISNVGKKGEIKEVKDGYAKNYLIKNNLAMKVTEGVMNNKKKIEEYNTKKKEEYNKKLEKIAEILKNIKLTFILKTSPDGKHLFGAITSKMISENILKAYNIKLDKKQICLKEKLNKIGNYLIEIKISNDIKTDINICIKGE